jgi:transcriptional regulator with XRE-family HTH domain
MSKNVTPTLIPDQQEFLDPETLGKFVRARRTQSGMGIHEAAAFCGVSVQTLSKIERALGEVHLSNALHVCRMLGISLSVERWEE